jgi:carbonic anhydrase
VTFRWEPFGRSQPPPEPAADGDLVSRLLAANRRRARGSKLAREPARSLAIVTCMDARLDPLAALGLRLGDAHVIRVAGADVGIDVLRSLALSRETMRTRTALVIGHSDCAAHGGDTAAAAAAAREGAARAARVIPEAHALLWDVATGRMTRA